MEKECDRCEGKGFYSAADGPDDSVPEFCDCPAGERLREFGANENDKATAKSLWKRNAPNATNEE